MLLANDFFFVFLMQPFTSFYLGLLNLSFTFMCYQCVTFLFVFVVFSCKEKENVTLGLSDFPTSNSARTGK